jgi:four helix bundle protein
MQNQKGNMTKTEMTNRTKEYAKRVVRVCEALPNNWVARTLGMQFLRCGTSVGSNYRGVCRAKSTADFLNKLKIVEEECDESLFWMGLLVANGLIRARRLQSLMQEGNELLAMIVAAAKTTRANSGRRALP